MDGLIFWREKRTNTKDPFSEFLVSCIWTCWCPGVDGRKESCWLLCTLLECELSDNGVTMRNIPNDTRYEGLRGGRDDRVFAKTRIGCGPALSIPFRTGTGPPVSSHKCRRSILRTPFLFIDIFPFVLLVEILSWNYAPFTMSMSDVTSAIWHAWRDVQFDVS
jgi:hypothetical protein